MSVITLTTDFGLRDPYVAAMKGIILGISPTVTILDLSHEIAPQNILECGLFLAGALSYFPEGSIHVVVVDPGVGSLRKPIAIQAGGQVIIGPDNGQATLFLRQVPMSETRVISNTEMMRPTISATFHGRDIFAPAAAHLAAGTPFRDLGEPLDEIVLLDVPVPKESTLNESLIGQIIHVDRFGNSISNIHRSMMPNPAAVSITAGPHALGPIRRVYSDVAPGAPFALFGSADYLEIAVNCGNAHDILGIGFGDEIVVVEE